jgi:hypothetical protein
MGLTRMQKKLRQQHPGKYFVILKQDPAMVGDGQNGLIDNILFMLDEKPGYTILLPDSFLLESHVINSWVDSGKVKDGLRVFDFAGEITDSSLTNKAFDEELKKIARNKSKR